MVQVHACISISSACNGVDVLQVFYAPHIAALSSTLGTRFQPLRYILEGDQLTSNVFYSSSLMQASAKIFIPTYWEIGKNSPYLVITRCISSCIQCCQSTRSEVLGCPLEHTAV